MIFHCVVILIASLGPRASGMIFSQSFNKINRKLFYNIAFKVNGNFGIISKKKRRSQSKRNSLNHKNTISWHSEINSLYLRSNGLSTIIVTFKIRYCCTVQAQISELAFCFNEKPRWHCDCSKRACSNFFFEFETIQTTRYLVLIRYCNVCACRILPSALSQSTNKKKYFNWASYQDRTNEFML